MRSPSWLHSTPCDTPSWSLFLLSLMFTLAAFCWWAKIIIIITTWSYVETSKMRTCRALLKQKKHVSICGVIPRPPSAFAIHVPYRSTARFLTLLRSADSRTREIDRHATPHTSGLSRSLADAADDAAKQPNCWTLSTDQLTIGQYWSVPAAALTAMSVGALLSQ